MKTFAERLANHDKLLGTIISLDCPAVAEIVSQQGFDWIFVDAEHGALDIGALEGLVRASCVPALIRIADQSEKSVKQALDIGATGVIVPQVNSAEIAAAIVAYGKYPPLGRRGVGVGRANAYGNNFANYLESANRETLVIAQIEHIDAVENIEAIINTSALSGILVGPNDLAASMNLLGEPDNEDVVDAIERVRASCAAHGMPHGIFHGNPQAAISYAQRGFSLIASGVDCMALGAAALSLAEQLKQGTKV